MPYLTTRAYQKQITSKTTSQPVHNQLLHELEILKFQPNGNDPAPYIDQAKFYFTDARSLSWRSGGLLFYYSFLNLAKALLINKGIFNATTIKGIHVDHGLSCPQQNVTNFLDLEISIKPANGKNNVFALLYEQVSRSPWPYTSQVTLKVRDIIPFIHDISSENKILYSIEKAGEVVYSNIRLNQTEAWYELITTPRAANEIMSAVTGNPSILNFSNVTNVDKIEWNNSHGFSANFLKICSILKFPTINIQNIGGESPAIQKCLTDSVQIFDKFSFPLPCSDHKCMGWLFFPKISIAHQNVHWHQMLSNYVFSFALGSVLRYRPYLIETQQKEHFLSEAWAMQAPITVLRDFVLYYNDEGVEILQN